MKNNKIIIVLALFFTIVLFSCNDNDAKKNDNNKTLKFWHFWSEPYQKGIIDSLVHQFELTNNVTVEIDLLSWSDGKTKLLAAFNSNTAPDVLELGSDWVPQFSSAGVLAELKPEIFNMDKYINASIAPTRWNNKTYALPWIIDTRVLFVNIDLLKQVGLENDLPNTIADLYNFSEKINSLENIYGIGVNGPDPHKLYKKILPMFWTYGGNIFKSDKCLINSQANINALNDYCKFSRVGYIDTQRQIDADFTSGTVGFCISGSWLLDKISKTNPNLNFKAITLPGLTKEQPGISFAGGEYLTINNNSNNKELAQKLIKYLTDGKNSLEFCKRINVAGFPADKAYYKDESLMTNPNKKVFAEQLKYAKMTPMLIKWLDIESIIEMGTVEALYGKKTPEQAIIDIDKQIKNL